MRQRSGSNQPLADSVRSVLESGFVVLAGTVSAGRLARISGAYDELMSSGPGPDFKVGSTTTRQYFVESRAAFAEVYQFPPLLDACASLIGHPFTLSSLLGRTLRAESRAQELHTDVPRGSSDSLLVGFILMLDPFNKENGATRFIPGSQNWPDVPSDRLTDLRGDCEGEILACGESGSMIIFNAAVWHGHTANSTLKPRRSIQGYFIPRAID